MKSHKRKILAPIIISVIIVLYYVVYFGILIALTDGIWKWLLGIIPLALSAVMLKVCIERVVNIRYASSAIMQGAAEVIVYGTAVKFV